jgi:hypothetical protein
MPDGNASGGFDCPVRLCWGKCPHVYPPVSVATDVCGDIDPTIPPNIDCSLCGLGWPQASGMIDFRLYRGTNCGSSNNGILGDYSYWLNGAYLPGTWRFYCANPGDDAEPKANEWVAGGDFSWGGRWRIWAKATVVSKTSVNVSATIWFLNPGTHQWMTWATFGQTMTEENPSGNTDPRRVRTFRSSRIAISPNAAAGGAGDVTHVSMVMGTYPQIVGCGTELCSMWDGSHYYSCFRAEVTDPGSPPRLVQLGKSQDPCGGRFWTGTYEPYCNCDQITLKQSGTHLTAVNSDPQFVTDYGFIGTTPGSLPYNVVQQIQVAHGADVVVKKIGGQPMLVATRLNSTDPYTIVTPTVVQGTSPTILEAVFGNPAWRIVRLYTLAFPNPQIVPDECSSSIDPVPPTSGDGPFWCVGGSCVQSTVQPAGSTSGPHATLTACQAVCGVTPDPYWCVTGNCVQAATAPAGASGQYSTLSACNAACSGQSDPYYCVDGSCIQSATSPVGATAGPFSDLSSCQAGCTPAPSDDPYYCVNGACVQSATVPSNATSGPYATEALCTEACAQLNPPLTYNCDVGGGCYAVEGYGGAHATMAACLAACQPVYGYFCWSDFENSVPQQPRRCIYGTIHDMPPGSVSGPFTTLDYCVNNWCHVNSPGYWCMPGQSGAPNYCVYSATMPSGAASGPYADANECGQTCATATVETGLVVEGTYQNTEPATLVVPNVRPDPVLIQPPPIQKVIPGNRQALQVVKTPCVHLGDWRYASGFG